MQVQDRVNELETGLLEVVNNERVLKRKLADYEEKIAALEEENKCLNFDNQTLRNGWEQEKGWRENERERFEKELRDKDNAHAEREDELLLKLEAATELRRGLTKYINKWEDAVK